MIKDLQRQSGNVSDKMFLTKRMECSLLIFISFYIMVVSIVFVWFYNSKLDAANFDSYDMLDDALESNGFTSSDDDVYLKTILNFSVNSVRCPPQNYSIQIRPGIIFNKAFDRAFRIRRPRRDGIVKYFHCEVEKNNQPLNITAYFHEDPRFYSQNFTFVYDYSYYDPDSGSTLQKHMSDVHLTFYSFRFGNEIVDGFSHDVIIDYSEQAATRFNVYIHCANEFLPYDFPSLSHTLVMAFSFVLYLVGCVLLLFFLWHCWSYKFVLIKRAIIESGIHFER
ncbi:hypothetical protein M9Y10_012413 [Tritrichomonas musculus]|uniref:Uncharacterized protein n=1 Tax=Tritrichomonas musculus TaxID=1915356 RepID=A0ABR2ICF7_9EUKA